MNCKLKAGFTIIEIAMALMVVSIGLVGIMSIFPSSLQQATRASNETMAALFAEQVLNGVRAQAATNRWDQIVDSMRVPAPTPDIWVDPENLVVFPAKFGRTGNFESDFTRLEYKTIGYLGGSGGPGDQSITAKDYVDLVIWYRLEIDEIDEKVKEVRLDVIPVDFDRTVTNSFYMELYNYGQQ